MHPTLSILALAILTLPVSAAPVSWRSVQARESAFQPAELSHPVTRDKGPVLLQLSQVDPDRSRWRPGPAHPLTRDRGPEATLVPCERDRVANRPDRDHPPVRDTGPVPARGD
jgi:hypothetical protein